MNVTINDVEYRDVEWIGNILRIETDMSLSQIEAAFIPGTNTIITCYEGDQLIARYYNRGIEAVTIRSTNPRIIEVVFTLLKIHEDAAEQLQEQIDDNADAIADLANVIEELRQAINLAEIYGILQNHQETLDTWFSGAENVYEFMNNLTAQNGILNELFTRLTAVEQRINALIPEQNNNQEGGNSNG